MRKKIRRGENACLYAIPHADWLPPESSSNSHHSQLVLAGTEEGSGPLCIVGREVQLVWYANERDRIKQRRGRLVAVLEFKDCERRHDEGGDRYYFNAVLLEDVSGEYRQWLGHQQHRGRPFGQESDVLETEIQFSVAPPERHDPLLGMAPPTKQPFSIHEPKLDELSSPQLDMIFDVMNFLYQSIPGMELMEELRGKEGRCPYEPGAVDQPNLSEDVLEEVLSSL
jgi:hypothetical protein